MCQPNCRHVNACVYSGTGYECDLNNDSKESLCIACSAHLQLEVSIEECVLSDEQLEEAREARKNGGYDD